jgi:hypothetical protein
VERKRQHGNVQIVIIVEAIAVQFYDEVPGTNSYSYFADYCSNCIMPHEVIDDAKEDSC